MHATGSSSAHHLHTRTRHSDILSSERSVAEPRFEPPHARRSSGDAWGDSPAIVICATLRADWAVEQHGSRRPMPPSVWMNWMRTWCGDVDVKMDLVYPEVVVTTPGAPSTSHSTSTPPTTMSTTSTTSSSSLTPMDEKRSAAAGFERSSAESISVYVDGISMYQATESWPRQLKRLPQHITAAKPWNDGKAYNESLFSHVTHSPNGCVWITVEVGDVWIVPRSGSEIVPNLLSRALHHMIFLLTHGPEGIATSETEGGRRVSLESSSKGSDIQPVAFAAPVRYMKWGETQHWPIWCVWIRNPNKGRVVRFSGHQWPDLMCRESVTATASSSVKSGAESKEDKAGSMVEPWTHMSFTISKGWPFVVGRHSPLVMEDAHSWMSWMTTDLKIEKRMPPTVGEFHSLARRRWLYGMGCSQWSKPALPGGAVTLGEIDRWLASFAIDYLDRRDPLSYRSVVGSWIRSMPRTAVTAQSGENMVPCEWLAALDYIASLAPHSNAFDALMLKLESMNRNRLDFAATRIGRIRCQVTSSATPYLSPEDRQRAISDYIGAKNACALLLTQFAEPLANGVVPTWNAISIQEWTWSLANELMIAAGHFGRIDWMAMVFMSLRMIPGALVIRAKHRLCFTENLCAIEMADREPEGGPESRGRSGRGVTVDQLWASACEAAEHIELPHLISSPFASRPCLPTAVLPMSPLMSSPFPVTPTPPRSHLLSLPPQLPTPPLPPPSTAPPPSSPPPPSSALPPSTMWHGRMGDGGFFYPPMPRVDPLLHASEMRPRRPSTTHSSQIHHKDKIKGTPTAGWEATTSQGDRIRTTLAKDECMDEREGVGEEEVKETKRGKEEEEKEDEEGEESESGNPETRSRLSEPTTTMDHGETSTSTSTSMSAYKPPSRDDDESRRKSRRRTVTLARQVPPMTETRTSVDTVRPNHRSTITRSLYRVCKWGSVPSKTTMVMVAANVCLVMMIVMCWMLWGRRIPGSLPLVPL